MTRTNHSHQSLDSKSLSQNALGGIQFVDGQPVDERKFDRSRCQSIAIACLAMACVLMGVTASSANFVDGTYSISVGESERILAAEIELQRGLITPMQLNSVVFQETCMNPSTRLHLRNRFAVSITNDASSQGDISSVTIDLTDAGFAFGNGDIPTDGFNGNYLKETLYFDDGVGVTAVPFLDLNDRSMLTLNFTDLTPGRSVIFRLDLDNNPDNGALTDYRNPLFGVDVGGTGTTTPAEVSATFTSGIGVNQMSQSTAFVPFSHNFSAAELSALAFAAPIEPYSSLSQSEVFGQSGRTVPEPASGAIALLGMAILGSMRRRNRVA